MGNNPRPQSNPNFANNHQPPKKTHRPYSYNNLNKTKKKQTPTPSPNNNIQTAEKINESAKLLFRKMKYQEAILEYQKAFKFHNNSKYLTNMAKCYLKMNQPLLSVECMLVSVSLSPNDDNLQRLGGIFAFEEFKQRKDMEMMYTCEEFMRNAFEINENHLNTHNYLLSRKIIFLVKQNKNFLEKNELCHYLKSKNILSDQKQNKLLKSTYFDEQLTYPEFLTCSITLEVLRDPVLTPCGYSYERKELEEWCRASGCKDVMTSRPFESLDKLVRNKALAGVIRKFLKNNPWALDTGMEGDEWELFKFK
jgi:STIP1 family protein 1